MVNPFEMIDARLSKIESLLLEKFTQKPLGPEPPTEKLLTRKEAAQELGVCLASIDNYARLGLIRKHYVGNTVRFRKGELIEAFSNNPKKRTATNSFSHK